MTGEPDRPSDRFRGALLDYASAFFAAEGALAGLAEARRLARPVEVEVSQLASALALMEPEVSLLSHDEDLRTEGSRSRLTLASGIYRCSDRAYLAVEASGRSTWARLCAWAQAIGIGLPTSTTPSPQEWADYDDALRRVCADHPAEYLLTLAADLDAPVREVVHSLPEAFAELDHSSFSQAVSIATK